MRISEFIKRLEKFHEEHGDLEVETTNGDGCRITHKGPMPLVRKLRLLAKAKNGDLTIADDAADAIVRMRDALHGVRQYGSDTLSGRIDGPDDRKWQRDAVKEMTRRARLGLGA